MTADSVYFTQNTGGPNLVTVCFTEGRLIAEYLNFRNQQSTDMADLEELEVDLRIVYKDMVVRANEAFGLAKTEGQFVPKNTFPTSRFDEHYVVHGTEILKRERDLSILFLTFVALAAGVEDRMARLTIRLNQRDSRLWNAMPQRVGKMGHTQHAGNVRFWLRKVSGLDISRLEEIFDKRNSAIHERYYFAHVIEESGAGDVLFTPAMNVEELTTTPFPSYKVTALAADVKWLIEVYLTWWCQESVRQIGLVT